MGDLILTLDAGTTGLKCSVFDETGGLVCACTAPYVVSYPAEGFAEQSAEQFYAAAVEAVRSMEGRFDPGRVAVLGLSGTMNGCLPVDGEGRALHPNIIHADTRAVEELGEIRRVLDDRAYYARTANRPDVHYTLPKLLWLRRHRPEILAKTRKILNTKDAIYGFLTGNYGYTDYSDASLTGMFRPGRRAWDRELLGELKLDPALLPEIVPSCDVSGRLGRTAAEAMGLPAGIPVSMGAGDGSCATRGAGVAGLGEAYCTVGSSAWLAALSEEPAADPGMRVFSFLDMDGRHSTVCGTVQCAAAAFDWAMRGLFLGRDPREEDFPALEAAAASSPAGSRGVFFLPMLLGERTPWWDPDARGTLVGMTCSHTRADGIRAVYEGVVQALRQCGAVLEELGLSFETLALIGGGAGSGVWPQMFADAFDRPVTVPASPRAATSLGAMAAAGVGVGIFPSYEAAAACVRTARRYEPEPAAAEAYRRHFRVYRRLYGSLREAFGEISAYQRGAPAQIPGRG